MTDFKSIEYIIEDQFPAIYREEGELMIQFVKAYYEYMSLNNSLNRDILENIDIDTSSSEYLEYFKRTYLNDFPFISSSDEKFMIKHIIDYYRTKGSEESIKLLLRLLFGEESAVYLPKIDILKPSDSNWYLPKYIEVTRSNRSISYINKEIVGSSSGAKAIVEGLVTKRVNGKYIDVLYLSDVRGFFISGDRVSTDGVIKDAPVVIGSLNSINVSNGGRNNKIGDVFDVLSDTGRGAKARVTAIYDETGRVNFDLIDGGTGYTITDRTDVYVSDAVVNLENENFDFIRFEKVIQKLEDISALSAEEIASVIEPGLELTGVNEANTVVATGTVLSFSTREESNTTYVDAKLLITSGTFDRQEKIALSSNASFLIGEVIEEESTVELLLSTANGSFDVGDRVVQATEVFYDTFTADLELSSNADVFTIGETVVQYNANNVLSVTAQVINNIGTTLKVRNIRSFVDPSEFVTGDIEGLSSNTTATVIGISVEEESTLYTGYAYGFVDSYANNSLVLKPSWGLFESGKTIRSYSNTDLSESNTKVSGVISTVDVSSIGARGTVSAQPETDEIIVENIFGEFTVGNDIRGNKTYTISTISDVQNNGATDIILEEGNTSLIAVLDTVANTTAEAMVIAQNSTAIGVHGNSHPFFSSGQVSVEGSNREIENIILSGNNVLITTNNDHEFVVSDYVSVNVDLQQGGEVKFINGIFEVISTPLSNTLTVNFNDDQRQIIQDGNFSFFTTSIQKTVLVPLITERSELISPPRDANGEIIEISKNVISVSQGSGASFKLGFPENIGNPSLDDGLENEETVFLATDIIGGNNVVGVPYLNIQINAANSGVGFVDSVVVNSTGSGYSNNQVVSFTGGGFASGEPLVPASATIFTDGSGGIVDVQVTNHGQGYWSEPTIVWPGGNSSANLDIIMDFGYGFPKAPNGDLETTLIDMWTYEPFTIGTISSLSAINPGSNYNQDPFVLVYNRYVAGFKRSDMLLKLTDVDGSFIEGEEISETILGEGESSSISKGFVLATGSDQIIIRRASFSVSFTDGYVITGETSGATATVVSVENIEGSNVMGDNAIVDAEVIAAEGIARELEVIDSGFGYENGEIVSLQRDDFPFVMDGISVSKNQGVGTGYWKTKNSHLNSTAKIHDNFYFQEFSYDIISGKSLDKYENILKSVLHVAGSSLFGTIEKKSTESLAYNADSKFEIL